MSLFQRLVQLAERIRDEFNSWKQLLGQVNGIATLGADGILTASQRPPGGGSVPDASETVAGIIRAATISEVGGSTDDLAVTPGNLRQFFGIARFASIEEALTFTGDDVTTTFQIAGLIGGGSALAVRSIVQVTNVTTGNVVKDSEVTINKDVSNGNLTLTFAAAPTTDLYSVCIITISGY